MTLLDVWEHPTTNRWVNRWLHRQYVIVRVSGGFFLYVQHEQPDTSLSDPRFLQPFTSLLEAQGRVIEEAHTAEFEALDDDQRGLYDEAVRCGATHDDAMEAATTRGYTR